MMTQFFFNDGHDDVDGASVFEDVLEKHPNVQAVLSPGTGQ